MMQFFTRVLVLTKSLSEALYTTLVTLVFLVIPIDYQLKLPSFILKALLLRLPPMTLTVLTLLSANLVLAGYLAFSKALFFL
jgi:hypothetical protein